MPMTYELSTSPKGRTILRMLSAGEVTAADAEAMNRDMLPGSKFSGLPILAVVEPGANFSPEARKAFTSSQGGGAANPVAIIVNSAPLRVMLTFILRISGALTYTKFFAAEAAGATWLDEKLDELKP